MKLSSKSITAIKFFIDLGEHYKEGYVNLNDIAKRKDLSKKFLEQIVPLYRNSHLLNVNRGNQGGYQLNKNPKDITLLNIIKYTENSFEKVDYQDNVINFLIDNLDEKIINYLTSISLSDILEKQKEDYQNNYII